MINSTPDFTALQQLLRLRRADILAQTVDQADLNRFLAELHRRQRAGLLVPLSPWVYSLRWFRHRVELVEHLFIHFRPALAWMAGGSAFAALALACFLSLAPHVQLNGNSSSALVQISLHLPGGARPTVGLLPSTGAVLDFSEQKMGRAFSNAAQFAASTPSFVLSDTHAAYDSRAAF